MLSIQNIWKKRRFRTVLKDCSFTVKPGKIVGIIGENGSGKTTLLKVIAGILKTDKGTANLDDHRSELISFSPDNSYFYDYFTSEQLIEFYATQFTDFNRRRAEELLDFFELDRKEKISYLSKGQVGRVKITVTLAREAPILLLDEPLAGLDPIVKEKIIKSIIQFINLEKQSLLITTHELVEIEPILDEIMVMKNGTIIEHQEIESIREQTSLHQWLHHLYHHTDS